MLTLLSVMSIVRPFGWTVSSYLQSRDRTRTVLWLDVTKVVSLILLIAVLGTVGGALWACVGVGLAYGVNAALSLWVVRKLDGVPVAALLAECGRVLAACAPLAAAVFVVRGGLAHAGVGGHGLRLFAEIAGGAVAYVVAARVVAREASDDLLRLARGALQRRARHVVGSVAT